MPADYSNLERIPNHIAFIPDGNRRWAREKGLPLIKGHEKGIDNIGEIVKFAKEVGVKELTFWGFSTENRNRTKEEVDGLMHLFETKLMELMREAQENKEEAKSAGVVIKFYGDLDSLPPKLVNYISDIHNKVRNLRDPKLKVNLLLNYGGRPELLEAFKRVAEDYKRGVIQEINDEAIRKRLWTGEVSPPDVIVRTSGEMRLSGFLPYQSGYSELVFLDKYWPDFNKDDFIFVLREYQKRERRFGK